MQARINFTDAAQQSSTMVLNGFPIAMADVATKLLAFCTSIQTLFNAKIDEYYMMVPDETALAIASQDLVYQSSMHKGLVTLGFAVADETHYRGLWIPAPNLARYELVAETGYRMKAADGATLLTALNTASDTTHTFRQGVLEFRGGRQAKPGKGGYLVMKDFRGRSCFMKVPDVTDKTKLVTFANTITHATTGYTSCGISKAVVMGQEGGIISAGSPTDEDGYASVALRSTCRFSYAVGDDQKFMSINTPALKSTSLQDGSGSDAKHRYVTSAAGTAIATALTTLYSSAVRDLTFEGGKSDVENGKR